MASGSGEESVADTSYKFDPAFEAVIVAAMLRYPKFYGSIGHAIEPAGLEDSTNQLIVKAVRAIAKDTGSPPSDMRTLLQRVHRWEEDGNVTQAQTNAVVDFVLEPIRLPPVEEIVAEVKPVLQRRLQTEAVRAAIAEHAKRGDFASVKRLLHQAESLGEIDAGVGLRLGEALFPEIEAQHAADRLPTGIEELDIGLDGGLPRGCLGAFAAPPGGGKSMFLNHVTAKAARKGYFVCVASLEINRAGWLTRLVANLTGEPITKIASTDFARARRLLNKMYPVLGTVIVKDFPAKLTSMKDITKWVDECAEEEGHQPHLLVVDYADKCKSHLADDARRGDYDSQGTIYETMRLFVHERQMWGWTASQPRRGATKEKRRRIELDDLAESNKKAHVVDLLITGNRQEDQIDYFVAKFRYGKSDFAVGPLPHAWEVGQMVPVVGT